MINSQDRAFRPSLPVCACLLAAAMLSACGGGNGGEAQPTSVASAAPSTPEASTAQAPTDAPAGAAEVAQAPAAEQPVQPVTTASATEPAPAPTDAETATTLATSTTAIADSALPRTVGGGSGSLSATLHWGAPKTLANGTFTASVAGFRVYYGTSPGSYTGTAFFPGQSASSGTVSGLGHGTWYFIVATVDAAGSESSASYQLSKTL